MRIFIGAVVVVVINTRIYRGSSVIRIIIRNPP